MPEHYFSEQPAGPLRPRTIDVRLAGRAVSVTTAASVFSPDHVDLGTRVLLDHVPDPPADGDLVDLGCGWGPVALAMALRAPDARVWAVDVNARALDLTATNARALALPGVRTATPDAVDPDVRFAALWSNPPIRVGKDALHAMLTTWLGRLTPDGTAHLVVARNLGADSLAGWLAEHVPRSVERIASAKGFRVLRVGPAD